MNFGREPSISVECDMTDRDYFLARAESELELARTASHPKVVYAHYELAGRYLDLAFNDSARPERSIRLN